MSIDRPSTCVTLPKSILSANALGSVTGQTRKIVLPSIVLKPTRQSSPDGFKIAMIALFNCCLASESVTPETVMVTVSSGAKSGEAACLEERGGTGGGAAFESREGRRSAVVWTPRSDGSRLSASATRGEGASGAAGSADAGPAVSGSATAVVGWHRLRRGVLASRSVSPKPRQRGPCECFGTAAGGPMLCQAARSESNRFRGDDSALSLSISCAAKITTGRKQSPRRSKLKSRRVKVGARRVWNSSLCVSR